MGRGEAPVRPTGDAQWKARVLARLRDMLVRKQEVFRLYLRLLEREGESIAQGDVERLRIHLGLESEVMAEMRGLARVIAPLEDLYKAAYPAREETIPPLQVTLERMGALMRERSEANRARLEEKMRELRREIEGVRARPRERPLFGGSVPALIDVTA